jgi:hypothetical protein
VTRRKVWPLSQSRLLDLGHSGAAGRPTLIPVSWGHLTYRSSFTSCAHCRAGDLMKSLGLSSIAPSARSLHRAICSHPRALSSDLPAPGPALSSVGYSWRGKGGRERQRKERRALVPSGCEAWLPSLALKQFILEETPRPLRGGGVMAGRGAGGGLVCP